MRRGEIYYIAYRETIGSEIAKARPAVIVSSNTQNATLDVVEVVYLTTNPRQDVATHVSINAIEQALLRSLGMNKPAAASDAVNHPSHYNSGKIEVIDFIEDQHLGFSLGNVVKYIARAGKKDPTKTVEDLKKAACYLSREIKRLSEAENG